LARVCGPPRNASIIVRGIEGSRGVLESTVGGWEPIVMLSNEEAAIVRRLQAQGCSVDEALSNAISLAMRLHGALFFVPRDSGDCYRPTHFRKIADEVERWGLELLPLDYQLGS
jgi:hypothetical protein